MSDVLYNSRILRLAAEIPHQARLPAPQASVMKSSPVCGSRITVDVILTDDAIEAFGQDVRACALGQASASLLGAHVIGASIGELETASHELRAFLKGEGPVPGGRFSDLELFGPAIPHRSRHASILLPFDAVVQAARQASGRG
jgi:NifU-like protein involved in Fe-S cluster formation